MKHLAVMAHAVWFLLAPALVFSHLLPVAAAAVSSMAPSPLPASMQNCSSMCGNVHIPFPFGISDNCSWHGKFSLTCNNSFNPPKPFAGDFEVVNIKLEAGEVQVLGAVSYVCYTSLNTTESSGWFSTLLDFTGAPYLISAARNEFTAIGCSTMALLAGKEDWSYSTGCYTSCLSVDDAAADGDNCTGLGCCQTPILGNLSTVYVYWNNGKNTPDNPAWTYSPCSYAFVAEKGWYNYSRQDLIGAGENNSFTRRFGAGINATVPLVLDWSIGDAGSCQLPVVDGEASAEPTGSACVSAHSYCINATQGPGYLCSCSEGYMGNPYVPDGCTNINECELRKSFPEKYEKQYPCGSGSTCHDTQGDYKCKCKLGHRGDGKSAKGCQPIFPYAIAIVATFVASILACFMIMELKKQKQKKFFDKNGGEILKNMGITIFTEHQLKKITNRYSIPIGEGAYGKVFMGTIDAAGQQQRVAVKRAAVKGEALPQEQFVNEIAFQFRISHVNVVRLIGCCLETDVPVLVFEFVPNGNLYNVLHGAGRSHILPLPKRLDIAIGSAEALSYMHSSHSGQDHVHGDIKSANILLDNNLMPKVSDFGSSKLMSKSKYVRFVSCDMNYIDPVYILTERFTAKSDVYSFGVVLLELITRKTVTYGNNSLTIDFKKLSKQEGNGRKMYDAEILPGDDAQSQVYMECLHWIGALAVHCLKEDVDERPTMAEVVEELKRVKLRACGGSS